MVDDLPEQLDWRLGSVLVDVGHVEVIDESNKSFVHGRTVGLTGFLIQHGFDVELQGGSISKGREVDSFVGDQLRFGCGQVIFDDLSLSGSCTTYKQHGLFPPQVHVEQVSETSCVDGRHEDLREDGLVDVLVDGDLVAPVVPLVLLEVPEVVVAESSLGELDLD